MNCVNPSFVAKLFWQSCLTPYFFYSKALKIRRRSKGNLIYNNTSAQLSATNVALAARNEHTFWWSPSNAAWVRSGHCRCRNSNDSNASVLNSKLSFSDLFTFHHSLLFVNNSPFFGRSTRIHLHRWSDDRWIWGETSAARPAVESAGDIALAGTVCGGGGEGKGNSYRVPTERGSHFSHWAISRL